MTTVRRNRLIRTLGLFTAASLLAGTGLANAAERSRWTAAWGASPLEKIDPMVEHPQPAAKVAGSFRYFIRLGLGGEAMRIRISNEIGADILKVASATIALANEDGSLRAQTLRPLEFGGLPNALVPPRSPMVSDPVQLAVRAGDRVAVTLYVPEAIRPDLGGPAPRLVQFNEGRDTTHAIEARGSAQRFSSLVTEIDILDSRAKGAIVTLGDSITQGGTERPLDEKGVASWPEMLSKRLTERGIAFGVVNAGIAGNRILTAGLGDAGLARFDRDVAAVAGATHLIVAEGINDIGFTGIKFMGESMVHDPKVLIAAYRQLIARAQARGLKVIGATITPFEGAFYFSPQKEAVRQAVNAWIRTSRAFAGVIDFDAAVRDPANPARLAAAHDSGDHLHPSAAGLARMAAAIDLTMFQ